MLRYEVATGAVRALARLPGGEGVVTMATDMLRRRIYCLGWPSGRLHVLAEQSDVDEGGDGDAKWSVVATLDYPGRGKGESVHPRTGEYRPVCRSMVVDPRTGRARDPLFMYVTYQAPHNPVQHPPGTELRNPPRPTASAERRRWCGLVSHIDDGFARVLSAFEQHFG